MAFLTQLSDSYAEVFDAIDSLRDAGIRSELIPKLVVIGDQNSGKSSVLEAICNIPFPVKEGLCTRFPTEVVQRKSSEESMTVTIATGDGAAGNSVLARFSRQLSLDDSKGLATAIEEASSLIMDHPPGSTDQKHFSGKILKITVSGPERYPLTIVDLPGLFYSSTSGQNQDDKVFVNNMVQKYIKEPRNALLPVLSASDAWTNMLIPQQIKETRADSDGRRSLGIITKLDKLCDREERETWLTLTNEGDWKPQHGWHFLRNRTHNERRCEQDRDTIEAEFFRENLLTTDEEYKGIAHLRPRLSTFLASQIQRHLGSLIVEIKGQRDHLNRKVNLLGKGRTSEREQRDHLARMAGDFQTLCCNAVNGHYGEGTVPVRLQTFFNDPKDPGGLSRRSQDKRLQAVVRVMNLLFNLAMKEKGKLTKVSEPDSDDESVSDTTSDATDDIISDCFPKRGRKNVRFEDPEDPNGHGNETDNEEGHEEESESQLGGECDDGEDDQHQGPLSWEILRPETYQNYESFDEPYQESYESFKKRVMDMAAKWRGTESLGEVNPAMVSRLFRQETSRWEAISSRHLELVWEAIDRFVHLALQHSVQPSLLPYLKRYIINGRLEKLRHSAEEKLEELLRCHNGMNPAFHDFLRARGDDTSKQETSRDPPSQVIGEKIREQCENALSSEAMEKIVRTAFTSAGLSTPQIALANILLDKVKETILGPAVKDGGQHQPDASKQPGPQEIAVRRAISTMDNYYKVRDE
ncbi:hypothetical protein NW754_010876 [Fusarium falciforme]|uniref:Dynamin-type G domain-containing protein n=1 Tax=Fusarium falciforme TaxID=195108 RepID=A0A9W8R0B5_9HYPO|nr:hypothetical protein NW754_010876 [Fusarium falciforme]KAJ4181172.1 hypothetical protein NW755_011214 [Fusarium falciforme]KAJ4204415.1 hypothetical protein NW767_004609 [Fusarium falciforme]KAJ4258602.1 hypothetical protein NW757_003171 [Fusarium falciforme]